MPLLPSIRMTNLFYVLLSIISCFIQYANCEFYENDDIYRDEKFLFSDQLQARKSTTIRLERDFKPNSTIAFTRVPGAYGSQCIESDVELRSLSIIRIDGTATKVTLDAPLPDGVSWYLCTCEVTPLRPCKKWIYAGKYTAVQLTGSSDIL